jgi:Xaa-Pro aminopeptidase
MLTKGESEQRIIRLQKELKAKGIDGALLVYPIDIYYFSGTRQNSILWIPTDGAPFLLVRKSLARARVESHIDDTRPFPSSKEFPSLFDEAVRKIGFTFDVVPMQHYNYYAKLLAGREFTDISAINREIHSIKSVWELEQMHHSGDQISRAFAQVPEFFKPGMRELDLSAEFERSLRQLGNEGYVRMRAFNQELFQGLAVSGESAAAPGFFDGPVTGRGLSNASPQGASTATIERDVPIFLDYTGIFNGYIVDMTRVFVLGRLATELEEAFSVALRIQKYLADNLKPGAICEDLFLKAAAMAEEAGIGKNFMGAPGENARFVGHGVGLELDELPVLAQGFKSQLQSGQTVAIEPKFVFPGRGVVGIENTFAVSNKGGVKLTDFADDVVNLRG